MPRETHKRGASRVPDAGTRPIEVDEALALSDTHRKSTTARL
jgi:hypothetical protein